MARRGLGRVLDNLLKSCSVNVDLNDKCRSIFEERIKKTLEAHIKSQVFFGCYDSDSSSIDIFTSNTFQANILHNHNSFREDIIDIYKNNRVKMLNVFFIKKNI